MNTGDKIRRGLQKALRGREWWFRYKNSNLIITKDKFREQSSIPICISTLRDEDKIQEEFTSYTVERLLNDENWELITEDSFSKKDLEIMRIVLDDAIYGPHPIVDRDDAAKIRNKINNLLMRNVYITDEMLKMVE